MQFQIVNLTDRHSANFMLSMTQLNLYSYKRNQLFLTKEEYVLQVNNI